MLFGNVAFIMGIMLYINRVIIINVTILFFINISSIQITNCFYYHFPFLILPATKIIPNIKIINIIEIQIGDSTHTQDQLILFVNFNTINIKVNTLIKPIPLFLTFLSFINIIHSFRSTQGTTRYETCLLQKNLV